MSFQYRIPLRFLIPANVQNGRLDFPAKTTTMFVKYLQEVDCAPLPTGPKGELEVIAVWRRDGRTKVDKNWWKVRVVADLRKYPNGDKLSLLEVSFSGNEFLAKGLAGKATDEARALLDVILEQDTIELVIDAGTAGFAEIDPHKSDERAAKEAAAKRYRASLIVELGYHDRQ